MLARLEGCHNSGTVQVVVQADVHGLDVIPFEQLAEIGIHLGDAEALPHSLNLSGVHVGNGYHLGSGDLLVVIQVRFADLSDANDAQAHFSI